MKGLYMKITSRMHYLPVAHKHTSAVVGVTLVRSAIDVFNPALKECNASQKQIKKILRWIDACRDDLESRKLSAGAKRDMHTAFNSVALLATVAEQEREAEGTLTSWGGVLWCAWLLIDDIKNLAQDFTGKKRCWDYLSQTTRTFAYGVAYHDSEIPVVGTQLYMELSPC